VDPRFLFFIHLCYTIFFLLLLQFYGYLPTRLLLILEPGTHQSQEVWEGAFSWRPELRIWTFLNQGKKIKDTRHTFYRYYTFKELGCIFGFLVRPNKAKIYTSTFKVYYLWNVYLVPSISFPWLKMFHLEPSPSSLRVIEPSKQVL
jgi:hypothetical protein